MRRERVGADAGGWLLGLVVVLAAALMAPQQARSQSATLPAMSVMSAPPVSPSSAQTFYGSSATHTNTLSGITGFSTVYPPEIVETARALKNDPDLIYEFVHNQIEVEYAFGLRKGPLGALIDKSGTPFDQNVLFVELVRQAGYTAQYQIGQVTIQASDFTNWTGVSDLQAACRLLASGGIPASFNGSNSAPSSCSSLSGALNSVTILHIWSQVQIGGVWYDYDPSFKSHTTSPGVNLKSTSGLVSGQAAAQAASTVDTGSQSSVTYIHNASETSLDTYLQARATQALSDMKANEANSDTDAVVGITKIVPAYKPSGGWRNTSTTPYAAASGPTTVSGDMPDQYRSTLRVTVFAQLNSSTPTNIMDHKFYVDEIDGRRLGVTSNFNANEMVNPPVLPVTQTYRMMLDDTPVVTFSCQTPQQMPAYPCPMMMYGGVTLAATHPYAANSGTYGSQTVTKNLTTLSTPFAIVSGWGSVSPALLAKWSGERAEDVPLPIDMQPPYQGTGGDTLWESYNSSSGDFTQQRTAASWLAQVTRMLAIQAQLGGSLADHQHSMGIVGTHANVNVFQYPPTTPQGYIPPNQKTYYGVTDQYTELNIDTSISVTSKSDNFAQMNAVVRSVAAASATLEGSVLEQMEDLPDTASTASRFAWADQPDNEDPCFTSSNPRRFYDFTGSTSSTRSALYTYEGSASGCNAAPTILGVQPSYWATYLDGALYGYVSAGFTVHGPAETFLGPGARFGPAHGPANCTNSPAICTYPYNDASYQRGGAFVATLNDSSGNVLQVAHILSSRDGITKGGGGKQPEHFVEYDPGKAADLLKDRFVDRSVALGVDLKTGTTGYTTPTLVSAGTGSAPYSLDY